MRSSAAIAPWAENTVKFATFVQPGVLDTSAFSQFFGGGTGYKNLDLTALVADWVSGALPNRGVLLREPKYEWHYFHTTESGAGVRPKMTVCYSVP